MLLGPILRYVCTLTMQTLCRRTKVSRLSNNQLAASSGEGGYTWVSLHHIVHVRCVIL